VLVLGAVLPTLLVASHDGALRFVIWDTEHTAWKGSNERNWQGLVPGTTMQEHREVIQLSALRVAYRARVNLQVEASLRVHIRPIHQPVLSNYVKQLTGIEQESIHGGTSLMSALEQLAELAGGAPGGASGGPPLFFSWGNDWNPLRENLYLIARSVGGHQSGLNASRAAAFELALAPCMHDVRALFRAHGIDTTGLNSGSVHEAAGVPAAHVEALCAAADAHACGAGRMHDSGWDVRSVLLALQALLARDAASPDSSCACCVCSAHIMRAAQRCDSPHAPSHRHRSSHRHHAHANRSAEAAPRYVPRSRGDAPSHTGDSAARCTPGPGCSRYPGLSWHMLELQTAYRFVD